MNTLIDSTDPRQKKLSKLLDALKAISSELPVTYSSIIKDAVEVITDINVTIMCQYQQLDEAQAQILKQCVENKKLKMFIDKASSSKDESETKLH